MPNVSGVADNLLDPVSEPCDAGIHTIVVWTPAAFAPAHHPGQEPATRWLLANQGTTRVSLTETDVNSSGGKIFMSLQHRMTIIDMAVDQYQ